MGLRERTILLVTGWGAFAAPLTPPRFIYWGKTLGKFVSAQLVVQALGMASGILLVRALTQQEYAYFTIAFAMQSTMNVLADSGVGIGLSSIGGRVWSDPRRFGQLVSTAMRVRRLLAVIAALVVTPILLWLLAGKGAPAPYAGLLVLLVLLGLNCQLSTGVLMIVPRLCKQIGRVQRLDLVASISRLVLLVVAYFIFLNAAVATFATLCSVLVQFLLLRRWVADSIDTNMPPSAEDRAAIISIIRSEAPNSVFYCIQGQLAIWLIAVFGNAQKVAEIGALSRLGIIFSVIGAVMASVVLPEFARCQEHYRLRRRYIQIVGAFSVFGTLIFIVSLLFPKELLWVLGGKYGHLTTEIQLIAFSAALSATSGAMVALNMAKGWVKYYWLNIPCLILLQIFLIAALDLSSTKGVLVFNILSLIPGILFSIGVSWVYLFSIRSCPEREGKCLGT